MELTPAKGTGRYISIKADGLFHEKVSGPEIEGSKKREWELKDGTKGEKWELLYKDIKNVFIKDVAFEDSDYGENILITFTDGESDITLAESTSGNFGSDIMKKLPNIVFSENMNVAPYAFLDADTGKPKRGVTFYQNETKVKDFFWDGEKNLHGFPVNTDKNPDKDSWKVHFINVKKFLVNYTKENIIAKLDQDRPEIIAPMKSEYPEEEIDIASIPF